MAKKAKQTDDLLSGIKDKYAAEFAYLTDYFCVEGITYTDDEVAIAIDKAWRAICKYMWWDYADYNRDYSVVVIDLAQAYFNNAQLNKDTLKGGKQITQQTQGSRSVTYRSSAVTIGSDGLTDAAKAGLPPRKLRVL